MFVIGLDLGQKSDYTAVAVVEKETRQGEKPMLYLRHLERFALGTPYGEQMDRVAALVEKLSPQMNLGSRGRWRRPELIVDATGVGIGVVEMLKDRGLKYRAVSITSGISETGGGGTYHVPKRNLVSRAVAPFEGKRLKIARGMRLVPELIRELENFKVKVNTHTPTIRMRRGERPTTTTLYSPLRSPAGGQRGVVLRRGWYASRRGSEER